MKLVKPILEAGVYPGPEGDWLIAPDDLERIAYYTSKRCERQVEIPVYDVGYEGTVIGYVYAIGLSPAPPASPRAMVGMLVLKRKVDKDRLVQASVKNFRGREPCLVSVNILRQSSNPDKQKLEQRRRIITPGNTAIRNGRGLII